VDVGAPVHRVASDIEGLAREVESAFHDDGKACREYFTRTHSSAEVLSRYEQLFEALA
jgi:hypothetical protein